MSDPATVEIAEMVLCGSINKGIASSIKRAGGRALGLSGKDDNLLMAKKLGKKIVDEETGEVKVNLKPMGPDRRVSRPQGRGQLPPLLSWQDG